MDLAALEEIRRLKYRYLRCVDLKLWDEIADVFTPDATVDYGTLALGQPVRLTGRDEIVAFLPLAALASASLLLSAVAFALFRLFDIWKPFPIRELEKRVKGGLGVMIDDVVAAFYAYIAFALFIIVGYKVFGFQ